MSKTVGKNVKNVNRVDISSSLISAVSEGDLVRVKKLVGTHGFSYCDCESRGYLLLFIAVKLGHINIAKLLLQKGAKADCGTDSVSTPLHLATKQRLPELVNLLLDKKVRVDARNEENKTALLLAAKEGYEEIVEALLNNNACVTAETSEGLTSLFLAAEGRHAKVVQILLKHVCANLKDSAKTRNSTSLNRILFNPSICDKINGLVVSIVTKNDCPSTLVDELIDHGFIFSQKCVKKPLLLAAVKKNYVKLMDSILKNVAIRKDGKYNPLLLTVAVKNGHREMTELLLNSGFNVDAEDKGGCTSLSYLSNCKDYNKYVDMLQLLLANGADLKKDYKLLCMAVKNEALDICKVLISNGANVNACSFDQTPLHLAVSKMDYSSIYYRSSKVRQRFDFTIQDKIVELLLQSGADASIIINGYTALHLAVLNGRKKAVSSFIKSGADVDLRAKDDSTPLFLAAEKGFAEIVDILCQNNADVDVCRGGRSLLHAALSKRKLTVIKILLKFGAKINFQIKDVLCDSDDEFDSELRYYGDYDDDFYDSLALVRSHSVILKAAGFHVRDQNINILFQQKCVEEVTRLKNKTVHSHYTLYDVLMNGQHSNFARNKSLMCKVKSLNLGMFPLYKDLITSNLQKSQFRLELLRSGQKWLDVLVKTSNKLNGKKYPVLPNEILEQMVTYLNNSALKSLISCGEALKRQLRH